MDGQNYLESTKKQFAYYKLLADKTIDALPEHQLYWQYNEESNSIAMLMQHLSGNMLSRFTDFLTTDGEKAWRNRDEEFANTGQSKEQLLIQWDKAWKILLDTLDTLKDEDLAKIVFIRNEGHTVMEAINRQLPHYAYHIGQVIFLGKMLLDDQWVSLSIPKGASQTYNHDKFKHPKARAHYIDVIMKETTGKTGADSTSGI